VEACREDAEKLLELNMEDLPFVLTEAADALAAHGAARVGDELIAWIEDGYEDFGLVRAIETIARLARDPDLDRERAAAALGPLTKSSWDYLGGPLELALPALGDPVLRHLPLASEEKSDISEWFFLFVAGKIGTERALFAVRRLLPHFADSVSLRELASWLAMLAHPSVLPVMEELCAEARVPAGVLRELEAVRILCGAPDYSHG
jgi:hypothetical protein